MKRRKQLKLLWIILLVFTIYLNVNASEECKARGCQMRQKSENPSSIETDRASASLVRSGDPNELHGPAGYDAFRWVSVNDLLHYTIYFENSEEIAGASAQIIDVRFQFPYAEMMNTFQLGEYNFALQNYPVTTKKANAHKTRIDLRNDMHIYVDLVAGLDSPNQQAYWHFSSIDPITGIAPWQFDRGMLPVNDSTHIGEGYVTFAMQPVPTMRTGDTISLFANILFDQNDTIPTNRWCNRVDAGAPQSAATAVMDDKNTLLYHIGFTATDDIGGCGVRRIHLYQEDYMGIWQEMGTFSPDTTIDRLLELGESYKLISIAEDWVGNREPFKTQPDIVLNANLAPTDILLSDSIFRDDLNPNGYIATISAVDNEESGFTFALAEGEGAIHNDLFLVEEDRLLLRNSLQCANDSIYSIRLSATDEGGLSFSKNFHLHMTYMLFHPDNDTTRALICVGDTYPFYDAVYDQSGTYIHTKAVENMCDSTYLLELTVLPVPLRPTITIKNYTVLISSASEGNQWMMCNEEKDQLVSTENSFIPSIAGKYYVFVDNGACTSEPSDTVIVTGDIKDISLTLSLAEGWNWFSSNLSDEPNRDVQSFLLPIQSSVDSLCGNSPIVKALSPKESYKILLNQPIQNTWNGIACAEDERTISLQSGWNRIGYPLPYVTDLSNTWIDFLPEEGDIIKTYEEFSVYHSGRWIGTLQTLAPGDGIMYYSQSEKTMQYASASIHVEMQSAPRRNVNEDLPKNTAIHRYPDNMTMVAELQNQNNEEIPEGIYTIMAYAGDEVIGISSYVEGKVFMMLYGDEDISSPVYFRAYNHIMQGIENVEEQSVFSPTALGSMLDPFVLHLPQSMTNMMNASYSDQYTVYPNPVRDRLFITGSIEDISNLIIYSTDGKALASFNTISESGTPVDYLEDGMYLVVIKTINEDILIWKIIKKSILSDR